MPLLMAFSLAVGLTAVLSTGLEVGIYSPLRRQSVTWLVLLPVSLGTVLFEDETKSPRSSKVVEGIHTVARITPIQLWSVLATAASFALV